MPWVFPRGRHKWFDVCSSTGFSARPKIVVIGLLLWMDEILHHFETMGIHCLLVFTGESSFQLGGAGFRPSTVWSFQGQGTLAQPANGQRGKGLRRPTCPKLAEPLRISSRTCSGPVREVAFIWQRLASTDPVEALSREIYHKMIGLRTGRCYLGFDERAEDPFKGRIHSGLRLFQAWTWTMSLVEAIELQKECYP